MKEITDEMIREEKFFGAKNFLLDAFERIPLTTDHRRALESRVEDMWELFQQASKS